VCVCGVVHIVSAVSGHLSPTDWPLLPVSCCLITASHCEFSSGFCQLSAVLHVSLEVIFTVIVRWLEKLIIRILKYSLLTAGCCVEYNMRNILQSVIAIAYTSK